MGTIDKNIMEKAGARGCSNSDYNIVITTCCNAYLVEDDELNDVYYDPEDLKKVIDISYSGMCPICGSSSWSYQQLNEWPKEKSKWQWAYHQNQKLVEQWLAKP
jgi:hypothetical protein